MLLEMHCHSSRYSACSRVAPVDLVRQVHAKELQGIILTEHHYIWSEEELIRLRRDAEVEDHFLMLAGQEVTTDIGDIIVYGARELFPAGTPIAEIRNRYPKAALILAHPYRNGREPKEEELKNPLLDAIEIFSSNHTIKENSLGLRDWHRYKFTAIAGTDTHGKGIAGAYPTQFDHPVKTIDDVAREIRAGHCRPFFKEIPKSGANLAVTEVIIGTKGRDEQRERIIIKQMEKGYQWSKGERSYRIMQAALSKGFGRGRYRVPIPLDADDKNLTFIEEALRGRSLFEQLELAADPKDGSLYLKMAAEWLAKFHKLKLAVTSLEEFIEHENQHLQGYLDRFREVNHPHTNKAEAIKNAVLNEEMAIVKNNPACLSQGHGDYHPKNILIGQDVTTDKSTLYISAIDFEASHYSPHALDVGCFLAQFRNMFAGNDKILRTYPESVFVNAYTRGFGKTSSNFPKQVELFRARTHLSIAAYLIKLGLDKTENFWRLLVEAERALSLFI